jgi:hypothetical protein
LAKVEAIVFPPTDWLLPPSFLYLPCIRTECFAANVDSATRVVGLHLLWPDNLILKECSFCPDKAANYSLITAILIIKADTQHAMQPTGRIFMEMTRYKHLSQADQFRGMPAPPLEEPAPEEGKFISLPPPTRISVPPLEISHRVPPIGPPLFGEFSKH